MVSRLFSWLINHSFLMGRFFNKPSRKEILNCFIATTLIGALLGIIFGFFALLKISNENITHPVLRIIEVFARSISQLIIFSTAFFLFCGIPGLTLIPETIGMTPLIGKSMRGLIYFVGGSLAMAAGLLILPYVTGLHIFSWQIMIFLVFVDGIISCIIGAVIFSYKRLELQMREQMMEVMAKAREKTEMQRLVDASKLSALQARINPHFFFNTLNSITILIKRDPSLAVETIEKLADLFRYTLQSSEEIQVPLSKELEFVHAYLDIEKLRFGNRLRIDEKICSQSAKCKIPGLILQPIVENSVRYGISPRPDGGLVRIETMIKNGSLYIIVADDGPGIDQSDLNRSGHALENIRKRLALLYGSAASLIAGKNLSNNETEMILQLPIEEEIG
ncbi:MAG: hypothetical protein A2161_08580 [Candidatus Schekmanbacteria bacterium RBG_13_48_7]|uniref:Signal transduction histidine kinase internal region domain-containing protein n=1 Tax=Candidatus Schekmanbacteria bacterium RBG_13_48_7 TaxID=1817878 RepID=A0A1F7RVU9_9BACT|nr:MAG: hypothetical protein A2161_08580 [Candidatus Schekmanbacteria bacterium RBG_13_48_7]